MKTLAGAGLCALALLSPLSEAAEVYRCVDQSGHLTLTRQGCPIDQTAEVEQAINHTPGSGRAVPLAPPRPKRQRQPDELTVVGVRDDGCGNRLSASDRRSAVIGMKVRPGMTRADIESSLGKPDQISTRNGQTQYRYTKDKTRPRMVSFDEHNCVLGKK